MTKETLAAALHLAYQVAARDGFQEEETWVLAQEIQSFNLPADVSEEVLHLYRTMPFEDAVAYIRDADEATKDEANALMMLAMFNDRVVDPSEVEAFRQIREMCGITRNVSIPEARAILGI
ncbi:MAG: hypothetical protein IKR37_01505 [Paludibacteraceae bacterium]|nr:hypothetical protein [Paludibacteraceae bacterium]